MNRTHAWLVPDDAYFMNGVGGQCTIIILPTHDLVVALLDHFKGQSEGDAALARSLKLLMEAVPRAPEPGQLPLESAHR